jgi:hypothetical protein
MELAIAAALVIVVALAIVAELPPEIAPRPEHRIAAPTEVPRAVVTR